MKFIRYSTAVCVTLLLISQGCVNRNNEPDYIISKYFQALGGLERIKSVQTLKITGQYNSSGSEYAFTVFKKRPNLYRFEIEVAGKKVVSAYDGQTAWELNELESPGPKQVEDLRSKTFIERNADFDGALVDYQKKGHQVEFMGMEDVDGTETYRLKVTKKDRKVENWYLNSSDFSLLKRTQKLPHLYDQNLEDITQVFFYMDHEEVDGLLIPHYVEREDMQFVREQEVHEVEINPELSDELFVFDAKHES